ncbi:MAG: hypothetical protein IPM58_14205 [Nitrospira sp.]|nr:hypothetical protein [Nitrospira sp.]
MAKSKKYRGEVPLHDRYGPEAKYAVEAEALLPAPSNKTKGLPPMMMSHG